MKILPQFVTGGIDFMVWYIFEFFVPRVVIIAQVTRVDIESLEEFMVSKPVWF